MGLGGEGRGKGDNFLKHDDIYTNINIYYYSKINAVGGRLIFNKNPYHFHNYAQFFIFVHFTNSIFCHVFVTNTAFVIFRSMGVIKNSSQQSNFLLTIKLVFWNNF